MPAGARLVLGQAGHQGEALPSPEGAGAGVGRAHRKHRPPRPPRPCPRLDLGQQPRAQGPARAGRAPAPCGRDGRRPFRGSRRQAPRARRCRRRAGSGPAGRPQPGRSPAARSRTDRRHGPRPAAGPGPGRCNRPRGARRPAPRPRPAPARPGAGPPRRLPRPSPLAPADGPQRGTRPEEAHLCHGCGGVEPVQGEAGRQPEGHPQQEPGHQRAEGRRERVKRITPPRGWPENTSSTCIPPNSAAQASEMMRRVNPSAASASTSAGMRSCWKAISAVLGRK